MYILSQHPLALQSTGPRLGILLSSFTPLYCSCLRHNPYSDLVYTLIIKWYMYAQTLFIRFKEEISNFALALSASW